MTRIGDIIGYVILFVNYDKKSELWKGPLKTGFCQESEQQVQSCSASVAEFHFPSRWRGEKYRGLISFFLLFAPLSSSTLQEEGGPPNQSVSMGYRIRGAPKPERAYGLAV